MTRRVRNNLLQFSSLGDLETIRQMSLTNAIHGSQEPGRLEQAAHRFFEPMHPHSACNAFVQDQYWLIELT